MSNRQERRAEQSSKPSTQAAQYSSAKPSTVRNVFVMAIVLLFVASTIIPGALLVFQSSDDEVDPLVLSRLIAQRSNECSTRAQEFPNVDLAAPEVTLVEGEVTELGLEDVKEGEGEPVAAGDCVVINYHGNLAGGLVFDSSFERATPFSTIIGESNVIQGWDQGIIGLKKGGIRKLTIPASLAYGDNSGRLRDAEGNLIKDRVDAEKDIDPTVAVDSDEDGTADYIPENATLVFYVELVDIFDVGERPGSDQEQ